MDLQPLDDLETMIRKARSVWLSASVVIPKDDALGLLSALRGALPREADEARRLVASRDRVIEDARTEAASIVAQAHDERAKTLSRSEVVKAAQAEATRLLTEAEAASSKLKLEADDWVDQQLGNFEILLSKVARQVHRGREQLRNRLGAHADLVAPLNLDDSGEISAEIPVEPQDESGPHV